MSRIKIDLPPTFNFQTEIPIRITDLNYGGHVGNDTVLTIVHEARMRFLVYKGFSELDIGGVGVIMTDAGIQFKQELFYGDVVLASVAAANFSRAAFDLFYLLEKAKDGKNITVAVVKTGMLCYDYSNKKIAAVPNAFKTAMENNGPKSE